MLDICLELCFFFFFQAEDGIRDIGVTGVQTCALPISGPWWETILLAPGLSQHLLVPLPGDPLAGGRRLRYRSEERRVGKSEELVGSAYVKEKKRKLYGVSMFYMERM